MKLHFFHKIFLILFLFLLTFFYAHYEKEKIYGKHSRNIETPVLKTLPSFIVEDVFNKTKINSSNFFSDSRGGFVHIWGTWCAPCEKEMPEFLGYASAVQKLGLKFLLIAVNDDEIKIHKFLKRFPKIPTNVVFAIDKENKVMDRLGTLKVPETFLFSSNGKHLNKFIGPQDWLAESYQTRLNFWLSDQKLDDRTIETH